MTRKEYTAIIQAENPSLGASLRMTAEEEQVEEEEEDFIQNSTPQGVFLNEVGPTCCRALPA